MLSKHVFTKWIIGISVFDYKLPLVHYFFPFSKFGKCLNYFKSAGSNLKIKPYFELQYRQKMQAEFVINGVGVGGLFFTLLFLQKVQIEALHT